MSQTLPLSMLAELEESTIMDLLVELTVERDTFKRMAAMYQQGYEETKIQLQQFQDLCFATQAELENERLLHPRPSGVKQAIMVDNAEFKWLLDTDWASTAFTREHLGQVEKLVSRREHAKAVKEIDRQLRGFLSPEARLEGILLHSAILRYSSDENNLLAALLKCKEAQDLCNGHPTLHSFRPKANFYKGVCLYRLKTYPDARIAFASITAADFFGDKAKEYMERCREEQSGMVSEDTVRVESRRAKKLDEVETHLKNLKDTTSDVSITSVEARARLALNHSFEDSRTRQLTRRDDADVRTFLDPFDIPVPPSMLEAYVPPLVAFSGRDFTGCSSAQSSGSSQPKSESSSLSAASSENSMKNSTPGLGIVLLDNSSAENSKPRPNPYGRPPLELDDGLEADYDDISRSYEIFCSSSEAEGCHALWAVLVILARTCMYNVPNRIYT